MGCISAGWWYTYICISSAVFLKGKDDNVRTSESTPSRDGHYGIPLLSSPSSQTNEIFIKTTTCQEHSIKAKEYPSTSTRNQISMCFGPSKGEQTHQQGHWQGVSQGLASNRLGGSSSSSSNGGGFVSKLIGGGRRKPQAQLVTMGSMSHSGGMIMGGSSGLEGGGGIKLGAAMGSGVGFGGTSGRVSGRGRFGRGRGGRSRF